jgi:hypothetical protein
LPAPTPRALSPGQQIERLVLAALFVCTAVMLANYPNLGFWRQSWCALSLTVFLVAAWCVHMYHSGRSSLCTLVAASLLLVQLAWPWLHGEGRESLAFGQLGSGLFVYAMIWVYAAHEREPGLQPLATAALMLSIGIVAKPAVLAACACLSIVLFLDERRRVGGWWRSFLLLLTPLLLCAVLLGVLNALWSGGLTSLVWGPALAYRQEAWYPGLLIGISPALCFAGGVLLSRIFENRAGRTDLAYIFLLGVVAAVGTQPWMPHALSMYDVSAIVLAGACSLLAMTPPTHWWSRAAALAGMSAAWVVRAS